MDILETLLLIIAWFFTLTWAYGVRVRPVVVGTSLVNLTMLIVVLFFTISEVSKFHLLWSGPLTILSTYFYSNIIVFPIIGSFFIMIGKIYTTILRIGLSKETHKRLEAEYKKNMTVMLNDLADKKNERT